MFAIRMRACHVNQSVYLSIHPCIYLSIHVSIYPSMYLSILSCSYLSIHQTIHLSIDQSIHFHPHQFIHPSPSTSASTSSPPLSSALSTMGERRGAGRRRTPTYTYRAFGVASAGRERTLHCSVLYSVPSLHFSFGHAAAPSPSRRARPG